MNSRKDLLSQEASWDSVWEPANPHRPSCPDEIRETPGLEDGVPIEGLAESTVAQQDSPSLQRRTSTREVKKKRHFDDIEGPSAPSAPEDVSRPDYKPTRNVTPTNGSKRARTSGPTAVASAVPPVKRANGASAKPSASSLQSGSTVVEDDTTTTRSKRARSCASGAVTSPPPRRPRNSTWSWEEEELLLALRRDAVRGGNSWEIVRVIMGRTNQACRLHHHKIKTGAISRAKRAKDLRRQKTLTPELWKRFKDLRKDESERQSQASAAQSTLATTRAPPAPPSQQTSPAASNSTPATTPPSNPPRATRKLYYGPPLLTNLGHFICRSCHHCRPKQRRSR